MLPTSWSCQQTAIYITGPCISSAAGTGTRRTQSVNQIRQTVVLDLEIWLQLSHYDRVS